MPSTKPIVSSEEVFDPEEIRRLVQVGKSRGLIRGGGDLVEIEKNGLEAAANGKVRSQWMDVTPDMAARWLTNNRGNRTLSDDTVQAYARDMQNGNWVPTHQGIAFNDQDVLIDGQHRLRAIWLSGKTIRMMVTFGLPSKINGKEVTTMDAVDRGRPRSVADQLKIQHGFSQGSIIAAICCSLSNLCCQERMRRLSVGLTLEVFREFEPAMLYVIEHRSKEPGLRSAGVMAAFTLAMMSEYKGTPGKDARGCWEAETPISKLFTAVMTGEGTKKDRAGQAISPAAQLREFLVSDEAKLLTRGHALGVAEMTLQAIHLEIQGKSTAKLALVTHGAEHFRALQSARVEKIAGLFRLPGEKKVIA
jgi:hypothetical protein